MSSSQSAVRGDFRKPQPMRRQAQLCMALWRTWAFVSWSSAGYTCGVPTSRLSAAQQALCVQRVARLREGALADERARDGVAVVNDVAVSQQLAAHGAPLDWALLEHAKLARAAAHSCDGTRRDRDQKSTSPPALLAHVSRGCASPSCVGRCGRATV